MAPGSDNQGPARTSRKVISAAIIAGAAVAAGAVSAGASTAPAYPGGLSAAAVSAGHPYRHGAVPSLRQGAASASAPTTPSNANNLAYGGGISGVGVTTGPERVYLVFWGSQWGSQGRNSQGNVAFSGDPQGMAPYLEAFLKGLGTGGETWSGVMTQYCQGMARGSQFCPPSAAHVGYPTGGALAGTWEDTSSPAPQTASAHLIGVEAVNAATHFGNTTQASNRNTQYVVISPTGTDPDNYQSQGFCAWHDYTGDSTLPGGSVNSPDGLLAFTNLPYMPDAGIGCGQEWVNSGSGGTLDGVSLNESQQYAETVTDQFPAGGWTDSSGAENGDKCAWIRSGQGASQDIWLTTGRFAVQSTWANDFNGGSGGCEVSHSFDATAVTVTNPGNQTSAVGTAASLQIYATDSSGQSLTYSASRLPAGLSINASGLISGAPTTAGTSSVTVDASENHGAYGSVSFTWTVTTGTSSCNRNQRLVNPGFESGSASPWGATANVINRNGAGEMAHSGSYYAWLDGYGTPHRDMLVQGVSISGSCHHDTVSFWLYIHTSEATTSAVDTLEVQVSSRATNLVAHATYSNLNANNKYVQYSLDVGQFRGMSITVSFTGVETDQGGGTTDFVMDDTALTQAP